MCYRSFSVNFSISSVYLFLIINCHFVFSYNIFSIVLFLSWELPFLHVYQECFNLTSWDLSIAATSKPLLDNSTLWAILGLMSLCWLPFSLTVTPLEIFSWFFICQVTFTLKSFNVGHCEYYVMKLGHLWIFCKISFLSLAGSEYFQFILQVLRIPVSFYFTKLLRVLFSPASFACPQASLGLEHWSIPVMVNFMCQFGLGCIQIFDQTLFSVFLWGRFWMRLTFKLDRLNKADCPSWWEWASSNQLMGQIEQKADLPPH